MKVKNWMNKNVVTISPDAGLRDAIEIMHRYSIRHLPVVEDGKMLGFVTESNLRQYLLTDMLNELTTSDVMIINPITIDSNASIDSAARLIHEYKIGGLPVLEKRKLVGIITITDILGAFIELLGLLEESTRLDVLLDEKRGSIDDVLKLIKETGSRIISVGVDTQSSRRKVYYIRLEKTDVAPIIEKIEGQGHKVLSLID
ncbi:MAG: CBS domain-containing protein [Thermodesulfobacteria bacterium]|nr:CBS domain-containing protein [Thermodesulfobacteriota bacterium]